MVGVAAGVRKGCKTTSIHSHRYMYSRAEECSVAVLMACACSVAVQWKQPDDHSSEYDEPGMPPCQKMLARLCSNGTEGDQRCKRVRRSAPSILPRKSGGLFAHVSSYTLLDNRFSKSSRVCCSVADMSSNFLLPESLSFTRNAPWSIRCFALILHCRRCFCHSC